MIDPLLSFGKLFALFYLSACTVLFFWQTRFVFRPNTTIEKTPDCLNLPYQDVWLSPQSPSGKIEQVHGWWIPAEKPLATLLFLHGNAINIGANLDQVSWFHRMGFSVLMIDYRGYGKSQGNFPKEAQVYQDAQAAWNYLVQEQKIPADRIILYGHSLGGAVAIEMASRHPNAAGLIVQSSFTSILEMAKLDLFFRLFPIKLLLTQRFNSIAKMKLLQIPVLFIHGTADDYIPAAMSEALYQATPSPKQLILVPGGSHLGDTIELLFRDSMLLQHLHAFVSQALKELPAQFSSH